MTKNDAGKISIITPVFNESKFIAETIRSVQSQRLVDWELIIVDDESTDSTVAVAEGVAQGDARVRIFQGMGKLGKVRAFNFGYAKATGDYVILLGGDDTLPPDSLSSRLNLVSSLESELCCAYFRLQTMSTDPRHDGIVIPKSETGNRSGGTMIASRKLAAMLFPIPEELVAEDVWLAEMTRARAETIADGPEIVLNYRIHPGNSNPRGLSFTRMTESIHERAIPYTLMLDTVDGLDDDHRRSLEAKARLEAGRYEGNLREILSVSGAGATDKLRAISMASPLLFKVRARFFRFFSGWH